METAEREAILAAVPLPMIHIAEDWRLAAANAGGRALVGAAALGRHYGLALRQPALVEAIEAVGRGAAAREVRYAVSPSVAEQVWRVTVAPAPGGGAICSFLDITEQELIGQLRRDFVANVSHELRTPLTALLGFIETLQTTAKDDPVARERFLAIMAREAGRMTRLVKDLLSLSRVEAEERQRPAGSVDLAGLLSGTLSALRPVAEAAGVELELLGGAEPLAIRADADQLTQVFHNLVENAVKYGGSGKRVSVRLERVAVDPGLRGPGVMVQVQDRGEGIDAIHLPRLTERFYRVDAHRSRAQGGTGLGLAIVKHIVNRHRGRLRIESEKGKGSTFTVVLPLA
ncbi:two-component system, OmpR family, phosphate regulon sensor histidine kinase PhoR [Gemmobacter aquatilis]|uniref:histidine kinase n=1 Tax=Gemmobacter aquatilis TaxID=933059 RepID=A0A1H8B440_9RHOB|nr:ATP-binding protein [Gemmobacter aquatilis]SEM77695.1 two-component system, OmpR family, phosphate regulon sensor histidine kinase PhoR [Gemmobacter aquatilis]